MIKKIIISCFSILAINPAFAEESCFIKNMDKIENVYVVSLDNSNQEEEFVRFNIEIEEDLSYALFLTNKKPVLWNIKNKNKNLSALVSLGESFSDYVLYNEASDDFQDFALGRTDNCIAEKYSFYKENSEDLEKRVKFMSGKDKFVFIGLNLEGMDKNTFSLPKNLYKEIK